jgi:predicted HAD superfamily Cof-like phosphohydrolase
MNKYIESVKEFHEAFGHPINNLNDDVDTNLRSLRIKLLFEELNELSEATGCEGTLYKLCEEYLSKGKVEDVEVRDKVEELDALADLQYILSGTKLCLGHQENFDDAFDEVQRSNMSKMCDDLGQALDTQKWYLEKDGTESYLKEKGDKYIVLRKGDNKILKNKYYSPADLKKFTEKITQ